MKLKMKFILFFIILVGIQVPLISSKAKSVHAPDAVQSGVTTYTDEDFENAKEYASSRFHECCARDDNTKLNQVCADHVCEYGLNADYVSFNIVIRILPKDITYFRCGVHC